MNTSPDAFAAAALMACGRLNWPGSGHGSDGSPVTTSNWGNSPAHLAASHSQVFWR